jgi:hypothetical protein
LNCRRAKFRHQLAHQRQLAELGVRIAPGEHADQIIGIEADQTRRAGMGLLSMYHGHEASFLVAMPKLAVTM